jgi:hypothetical protein
MSLENPNKFEKLMAWPYLKVTAVGVGLLIVIGLVAFGVEKCGDWRFDRSIDRKKANVNAAVNELKAVNANIAAEKKTEQEIIANIKVHTDDYLEAVNTTDGTREAVNAAIERMKLAANSNRGNVNAADVEEVMRGL